MVQISLPPIPSYISKHPYFGELVPIYAEEMKLKDCPAETKLDMFNSSLRAIGREVRDHLLTHDPDGNDSKRLVLNSISRAVWGQKDRLARQLLRSSELARRHLYIDTDLGVMLIDPVRFDAEFNEVRLNDRNATIGRLQGDLGRVTSSNAKKKVVSQLQAQFRMRALHWPRNKTLKLAGLKCGAGSIASSPSAMQDKLKEHWAPIYSEQPINEDLAAKALKLYSARNSHSFKFSDAVLPDKGDFREIH